MITMSEEKKVGYYFLCILLPLINLFMCGLFNFEFIMGNTPTIKNLLLTIIYIAVWIYLTIISKKIKSSTIFKIYIAFWMLTLFSASIVFYGNIYESYHITWGLLFVGIFTPQWYGIRFFINDFIYVSLVIGFISFIFLITNLIWLKLINK